MTEFTLRFDMTLWEIKFLKISKFSQDVDCILHEWNCVCVYVLVVLIGFVCIDNSEKST